MLKTVKKLEGLTKESQYNKKTSVLKRSKSLDRKRITDIDMFLQYPYKKRHPLECLGRNSFPKSEISDHKYAVTLKEYREVINGMYDEIVKLMIAGEIVKLPHNLGYLCITKCKKKTTDIRFMTYYSFYFTWKKTRMSFVNQRYWRFRPLQKTYTRLYEAIRKDVSLVNNYIDISQNVHTFKYLSL